MAVETVEARLWIGTYPAEDTSPGSGEGIWEITLNRTSGKLSGARLVVETPSASFLAERPGGGVLYAVSEGEPGTVSAFAVTGNDDGATSLVPHGPSPALSSGGSAPCHILAQPDAVWVSNYGDGTFTVVDVDHDGAFKGAPRTFPHEGSGPNTERQEGPHAHFSGDVDGAAWVADLGTDQIRRYSRGQNGLEPDGIAATLPPGTGPRHFATYPGSIVVAGELDCALHVVHLDGTTTLPGASATAAPTSEAGSFPSHIARNADGTRLYVAVRGPDVLATFSVTTDDDGRVTAVEHLSDTSVAGRWPRHFAVISGAEADLVVVANQLSSELAVLRMDHRSGAGVLLDTHALPAPACVLPGA